MKVNNRQLLLISFDEADFEGRLHYKKISMFWSSDNKGFKERWFKLKHNMLFYFKMNETHPMLKEPAGVFILENYDVQYEENSEVPFSFSISFNYEPEVKYLFSARSEDVVFSWICILRNSSFSHLKEKLQYLKQRIQERTERNIKAGHKTRRLEERVFNFSNIDVSLENLNINNEKTESRRKKEETDDSKYNLPVSTTEVPASTTEVPASTSGGGSTKSEVDLIVL
ncbi:pleckstrin homology domain-containing family J member 1 [Halyomorpha halys]|uniref:pleckstrin homology domain-containing family J member 1 n=1 Tax=Halyomorpha halys TaxID=286706 RepID=UPI0006D4DAB5|nr:pleckstrin homology domain-containing family J member 1 [Halyomorpha halys]